MCRRLFIPGGGGPLGLNPGGGGGGGGTPGAAVRSTIFGRRVAKRFLDELDVTSGTTVVF
jgi:hypothetical protein